MATTQMETLSPTHKESGAKTDNNLYNSTDARTSKSDSSSDEERCGKTGPNKSSQNILSTSQSQKRPMNAFLIFCKRHRSVVRQKYPHLENRSITKILGEWWAALDADQKQNYTELARQYKEAFMRANPHFKWYKTTDLRPPIAPPSPPPIAVSHLAQNPSQTQPQQQQQQQQQPQQTQSTPKPPKKRYLENLENGEYNKVTTNTSCHTNTGPTVTSSPAITPTSCSNAGPPILDIETANRVIENALSGSVSNSSYSNNEKSAFNSDIISGHINSVIEQHTIETRELEALERSSQLRSSSPPSTEIGNSITTQSTTVNNSETKSISHSLSPLPSDEEDFEEDNEEDKPLNLSSSTVLHTSNQHIIDHFIDKLLSTGIEGPSSSSMLPFTSPPLSSMSSMSNFSPSTTTTTVNTNNKNTGIHNHNNNTSNNNSKQSRKERTCKGKRYLEILNENKYGKRNRAVSPIGNNTDKDEVSLKIMSGQCSGSQSKWVSGGFDLEEHIAALPQLGDTHLLNALSHSKANKTVINHRNANNENNFNKTNNCLNKESITNSGDGYVSDNDDNELTTSVNSNKLDNTLRHSINNAIGLRNSNENNESDKERKNEDSIAVENDKSDQLVAQTLRTTQTQGLECNECDGLAALAEVALQQPRNNID